MDFHFQRVKLAAFTCWNGIKHVKLMESLQECHARYSEPR